MAFLSYHCLKKSVTMAFVVMSLPFRNSRSICFLFIIFIISYRYDNEDNNSSLGFFAHYVVQKTPYFKGGVASISISHF